MRIKTRVGTVFADDCTTKMSAMLEALVVDAHDASRRLLTQRLGAEGLLVSSAATLSEARARLALRPVGVVFVTPVLPDGPGLSLAEELMHSETPVVLAVSAGVPIDTAAAIRSGAADLLRADDDEQLGRVLTRVAHLQMIRREVTLLREELRGLGRFGRLVGASAVMDSLYDLIRRAASRAAPVWIVGERGTGKRLVAQTIHTLSRRTGGAPLVIECDDPGVEAGLFGYEAVGGEPSMPGALSDAADGTVVLARLDEMPVRLQSRLAAALATPAGRRPPARILVTSGAPPEQLVSDGRLIDDLWRSIQGVAIEVPPLRRRHGDVTLLAEYFLANLNRRHGGAKRWSAGALGLLEHYLWPGNVRQLQQLVHQAFTIGDDELGAQNFAVEHAHIRVLPGRQTNGVDAATDAVVVPVGSSVADAEQRLVLATLRHCGGNKQRAAQILGVSLKTLYNRLHAYRQRRAGAADPARVEYGF
jgi:two-component system, NtrC family, response regulator AtoC